MCRISVYFDQPAAIVHRSGPLEVILPRALQVKGLPEFTDTALLCDWPTMTKELHRYREVAFSSEH